MINSVISFSSVADTSKEDKAKQDKVTEEKMREALRADKGPDARLLSWQIKDFTKKGDNYACIVTSVVVQYMLDNKQHETTYVAKVSRDMGESTMADMIIPIFKREGTCLSQIVPSMNKIMKDIGQKEIR